MKITLKESQLRQIVTETVRKVLKENLDNVPEILRQNPSALSDEELKYALKYLSANADEYSITPEAQLSFDAFWDEWNNRQSRINETYEITDVPIYNDVLNEIETLLDTGEMEVIFGEMINQVFTASVIAEDAIEIETMGKTTIVQLPKTINELSNEVIAKFIMKGFAELHLNK